ncbi:hypothetical protein F66182_3373 [Fusarium sp. NRRL 66182]|nr:hypothetical protein F66182_3373 [Fusarium sp. NRRL 66182]
MAATTASDIPSPLAHEISSQVLTVDDLQAILAPIVSELSTIKQRLDGLVQAPTLEPILDNLNDIKEQLHQLRLKAPASPIEAGEGQTPVIRYILAKDEDARKIISGELTTCMIRETLHKLGPCWNDITSVRFVQPKVENRHSHKRPCLLFTIDNWESEDEIRKNASDIGKALNLSTSCYPIPRHYMVEVLRIADTHDLGSIEKARELAREVISSSGDITVRVAFNRFLIGTTNLDTARWLCQEPQKFGHAYYDVIPFSPQGTPLFCYNCWEPGHFQEACGSKVVRCGRCAENHSTRTCDSKTFRCCNCTGAHPAWDNKCPDGKSRLEHQNSALRRHVGPNWAPSVHRPSQASRSVAKEPQKTPRQQEGEAASKATPPSSQETLNKKRGRPSKFDQRDPGQQRLNFTKKTVDTPTEPDASAEDVEMTGMTINPTQEIVVEDSINDATDQVPALQSPTPSTNKKNGNKEKRCSNLSEEAREVGKAGDDVTNTQDSAGSSSSSKPKDETSKTQATKAEKRKKKAERAKQK